jgi:arsenate reductase-like glutaredoxin family protein
VSADDRRESTRQANRLFHAALIPGSGSTLILSVLLDTRATLEVQIFGIKKSADTRKALRFFSERRVKTHFVDLKERPASIGELRRFAQKFGVRALVDRDAKRFAELGLQYAQLSDDRWLQKLSEEPLLLRIPLVRNGNLLVIGADEAAWKTWMEP